MALKALLQLTLLGLYMLAEAGSGQKGDRDFTEWLKAETELTQKLEDEVNDKSLEARLNSTVEELTRQKAEMDQMKKENKDLQTRLNATEEEIGKLKEDLGKAAPQVAFSASLVNSDEIFRGPSTDKTLVFKRVFSNAGDAYDQNTGMFTAPVNGLYYFSFSTYGYNTHVMGAILMKNNSRQISTYDHTSVDGSDSSSNAVVLPLVAGDKVHMELWDNGRVFDNLNGHTTFSGFLLFPM